MFLLELDGALMMAAAPCRLGPRQLPPTTTKTWIHNSPAAHHQQMTKLFPLLSRQAVPVSLTQPNLSAERMF